MRAPSLHLSSLSPHTAVLFFRASSISSWVYELAIVIQLLRLPSIPMLLVVAVPVAAAVGLELRHTGAGAR